MRSEIVRMRPDEKTTSALRKLIEDTQLDGIVMVEVGSYAGESAEAFVSAGKVKTIYCVDPWLPGYDKKDIASDTDFNMVESAFDEVQSRHIDTIVKFKGVLKDFAVQHPNLRPDLIYIDACHTYEACKEDISTALSMSPKFVSGHDYVKGWSGVMKAVDEMFGKPDATYEDESWMVDLTKERGVEK